MEGMGKAYFEMNAPMSCAKCHVKTRYFTHLAGNWYECGLAGKVFDIDNYSFSRHSDCPLQIVWDTNDTEVLIEGVIL